MGYELKANIVEEVFMDCLFKPGEIEGGKPKNGIEPVVAKGLKLTVGFHPERLEAHKDEIMQMLMELPENFREGSGSGWTFLNACNDRHGNFWTGDHKTMDELVMLGLGIGRVKYCTPREMWDAFPGGVPYFMITKED